MKLTITNTKSGKVMAVVVFEDNDDSDDLNSEDDILSITNPGDVTFEF